MDFGFVRSIEECRKSGRNAVIAEIKPRSPLHGDLLRGRDPLSILKAYENAGVAAVSYITAKQFGGSFDVLRKICRSTELPVLRKDFVLDVGEIERSCEAEVAALLLIARFLKEKTAEFADICWEHAILPLVEVHREEDLRFACGDAVLINNRDIERMESDAGSVEVTERIAPLIDAKLKVSGSGIGSVKDLCRVLRFVDAALIGTAFMLAENTEAFVRNFVEARL